MVGKINNIWESCMASLYFALIHRKMCLYFIATVGCSESSMISNAIYTMTEPYVQQSTPKCFACIRSG